MSSTVMDRPEDDSESQRSRSGQDRRSRSDNKNERPQSFVEGEAESTDDSSFIIEYPKE